MSTDSLKTRVSDDTKSAMRSGDKPRLATLRLINAAILQREVDERITLDDTQITAVLDKMAKQRRESIEQYHKAAREDLVAQEEYELTIILSYLPTPLDAAQIERLITQAIDESNGQSIKDMGKVMAILKPQMAGRVDMAAVGAKVKAALADR